MRWYLHLLFNLSVRYRTLNRPPLGRTTAARLKRPPYHVTESGLAFDARWFQFLVRGGRANAR
jgi:hypothetical protein